MPHLFRLIKILNVAAKYRLGDYLRGRGTLLIKAFLWFHGLPWTRHQARTLDRHQRLRLALEELGPIYIKFGQLLSTRRDFLEPRLADALQGLQDNVPPFQAPGIEELISTSLDREASEIFSDLSLEPLASASIAQVHAARLMTGEDVVVKVIRPGIEKTIRADVALLKWLAIHIETRIPIGKRLRPVEVINDYEKVIFDELNLLAEGANTTQLRRNFETSDVLYVPRVYWEYSRRNLLVMERIYGIPVADIQRLEAHHVNLKKLAETGVEIFFTQVFEHCFFHADMHPGNIFVNPDRPDRPQYIAIDCAIIGSLSPADQLYLARNLLAIFKRDYRKVAELHVECGWVPKDTRVTEFEAAMRTVCEPIFEKPLKDISFGQLLVQLFRTAGRFNMEVQPSLVLLQKTLLNIEGLGRQLYPELDLWETALPYLEKWNARRLSPVSLFNRLRENIPDWVDQLPDLPQLSIDAVRDARQLREISASLSKQQEIEAKREEKRRSRAVITGSAFIVAALLSLHPTLAAATTDLPLATLLLGFGGLWLVARRQ
ncbi:MAG: ubiquinone biosynthesis regulatory protein kinase UbiB [Gammaproteobacteria bacterium]|nr:ubiquinone biosynthesis regulatory protein kinase UbiB [Pseudomonadales bacterium]